MKLGLGITLVCAILLAGGIGVFALKPQHQETLPLLTQAPQTRDIMQYINASGNLQAKDQITIGSLVNGRIIKLCAENNDVVKKGQVLAVLDNGIGTAAMQVSQALLEEARFNLVFQEQFFARQKELYLAGQLAQNFFEQYERDLQVARAEIKRAEGQLSIDTQTYENLSIRAPENGTVIEKKVDLGQSVTAILNATVLFTLAKDLTDMEARIDVDEADVGMVKDKQDATFTVDAFPKEQFNAKVKEVQYQAKIVDNIVTYPAILRIRNDDLRLRPGMTVNADINVAEVKNVPTIPNKALRISKKQIDAVVAKYNLTLQVLTEQEAATHKARGPQAQKKDRNDYVWVLSTPNTIAQRMVTLGASDGKFSHVVSGLTQSDAVIVEVTQQTESSSVLKDLFRRQGDIGSK